jgi:hypothetical protein
MRQVAHGNIIRRMPFACCMAKDRDIHSEYVTLIPFPQRQWLRERASMLRLYVHYLSCSSATAPQSSVSSCLIRHSPGTDFLSAKILCDADNCTHYGITSLRHEFQQQSCENLNTFSFCSSVLPHFIYLFTLGYSNDPASYLFCSSIIFNQWVTGVNKKWIWKIEYVACCRKVWIYSELINKTKDKSQSNRSWGQIWKPWITQM